MGQWRWHCKTRTAAPQEIRGHSLHREESKSHQILMTAFPVLDRFPLVRYKARVEFTPEGIRGLAHGLASPLSSKEGTEWDLTGTQNPPPH